MVGFSIKLPHFFSKRVPRFVEASRHVGRRCRRPSDRTVEGEALGENAGCRKRQLGTEPVDVGDLSHIIYRAL